MLGLRSVQCPLMWTDIINDIAQSDAGWRLGVVCVCVCVVLQERKKTGVTMGGEDEKTRGASFDAVNVQIYVEGQWSTFIRSAVLPLFQPHNTPHPPTQFFCCPTPPYVSPHRPHPPPLYPLVFQLCHPPSFFPSLPCFLCLLSVFPDSLPASLRLLCLERACCGLQRSDQ